MFQAMQQQELGLRKHTKYKTCHFLERFSSLLTSPKKLHKIKVIISLLTYKNNIFRNIDCIKKPGVKMKCTSTIIYYSEEKNNNLQIFVLHNPEEITNNMTENGKK